MALRLLPFATAAPFLIYIYQIQSNTLEYSFPFQFAIIFRAAISHTL